ncbi:MAG TPA: hypothetical protein VMW94_09330, partial [Actinomycetes bacterium]|nr:hypothetical protein [Actinomycetes bacterium]
RALLGCGPFYGTRCDSSTPFGPYSAAGGVDFLNMEASALVMSWPGFEGTLPGHTVTSTVAQPGTANFFGGPTCTRFVEYRGIVKLPGCRGVNGVNVLTAANGTPVVDVWFEDGYLPSVDGCVIGTQIQRADGSTVPVIANGGGLSRGQMLRELALCNNATTRRAVPKNILDAQGQPTIPNPRCAGQVFGPPGQTVCNAETLTLEQLPLIHPLAGCIASNTTSVGGGGPVNPAGNPSCRFWFNRDLTEDFLTGSGQLFQSEMAAFSYNFLQFLAVSSCNLTSPDLDGNDHRYPRGDERSISGDPECFWATQSYAPDRCSFNAPHLCSNVKGFLSAAGTTSPQVRAGGNEIFGRRTFVWHSGSELLLRYEKRNVLGLSMDFAEDLTKTNWGVEFTWIEGNNFADNDSPTGTGRSDALNLTLSVDRPTFINFLNPNRTFFFNSQWFFSYLTDYKSGFTNHGPFNALFTFAMFTGYYQDRVLPQFVTVYDFRSGSGGLLPSLQYRFTEAFSVTIGMNYFWGRTELVDMPIQEFGPAANRGGNSMYFNGQDNLLSLIRKRDEVYLRLRWTF